MNILPLILLTLSVWVTHPENKLRPRSIQDPPKVLTPAFQILLDSAHVTGSILVYDPQADTYYSNNFERAERSQLPASTYKIPHSIIALETGVVNDDSTLFPWDGEERAMAMWEQDLIFRDAFRLSCVPCYQDVARRIGEERMREYLKKLDYGTMDVTVDNIDQFWLEGNSRISQYQQIDFLRRFYRSELPIADRTEMIVKRMMIVDDATTYRLSGKTGWAKRDGYDNGWFVGYLETKGNVYFFATNIEPQEAADTDAFIKARAEVTRQAFQALGIIA